MQTLFAAPDGKNRDFVESEWADFGQWISRQLLGANKRDVIGASHQPDTLHWQDRAIQGAMNPAHPFYMGHMDPLPTLPSVFAHAITGALNNNMLSHEMSPMLSEIEPQLLASIARRFGMPETAGGVMQSGGTLCNLLALTVARNQKLDVKATGLTELKQARPVVLVSEHSHSSLEKACMMLGLGTQGCLKVPTDATGKLSVQAIEAVLKSQQEPVTPFALVATAGTTVLGTVDQLEELAEYARENQLWFHVDASYGGAAIFSEQHQQVLEGIEQADSITFNPQKWCYVTKTSAMVLFREFSTLVEQMSILAPYMNRPTETANLGEFGVQGTRPTEILALWASMETIGAEGFGRLVDYGYQLAETFLTELKKRPHFELAVQPDVNVICFRLNINPDQNEEWNRQLQQQLQQKYNVFISAPVWQSNLWLKAVLLNPFTTTENLQQMWKWIDEIVDELAA